MRGFQNLTLRCIKGQPISDVVCRRLTDMGFPVDAPSGLNSQKLIFANSYLATKHTWQAMHQGSSMRFLPISALRGNRQKPCLGNIPEPL